METVSQQKQSGETTYLDSIRQGLIEEMRRDDSVFLMGEDIGAFGGAFKVTLGLLDEFGPNRVIDTPIAETAMLGMAIGAAMSGLRPVVEMQFADFVLNGFNQLVTNAAKVHYRVGQPVPLTVRLPAGGGVHGGPFHSSNPEAWFMHVPGLKIVAPCTANDARGLIKSAIRDNNPVLFLEHKYLYRRVKEQLTADDGAVPIGVACVAREGTDATVITYGAMVYQSLEAAEALAANGISIEVIDLRSILPWDRQSVLKSVKKTARALVVHEATLTCGVGAEIAAVIGELAFEYLDAPVSRIASHDTPVPFAPPLEEFFMPNAAKIETGLRALIGF